MSRHARWIGSAAAVGVAWGLVTGCARDRGPTYRDNRGTDMTATSDQTTPELELVIDARYVRGMGYGNVWRATVREVVAGTLADGEFDLRVLSNSDGSFYHGRFTGLTDQRGVRLRFRRIPERPAALIGFVAGDGAIWEVVEAR